jgi:hypothetical protein
VEGSPKANPGGTLLPVPSTKEDRPHFEYEVAADGAVDVDKFRASLGPEVVPVATSKVRDEIAGSIKDIRAAFKRRLRRESRESNSPSGKEEIPVP